VWKRKNKMALSESKTFFVYYVLQIIVFIIGFIFVIRGIFDTNYFFLLGVLLIILSGYMRFKYKVRKVKHQRKK
tara:strand:- start:305 stop:526 length:222 start_codon:yes stop_codon:yes gene_type:complete